MDKRCCPYFDKVLVWYGGATELHVVQPKRHGQRDVASSTLTRPIAPCADSSESLQVQ